MKEEEMKQLLKEMQENCVKGMLKGAIYEDEKAEQKAIAIDLALNLIENQKAEIEKKDNQLKEKNNIINKTSLEAQRYFDTTIEQALKFDKELEKKDRTIELMAEQLTTPIHEKNGLLNIIQN